MKKMSLTNAEAKMDKPFKITSVAREDLLSVGFTKESALKVTDEQMERIAHRMANVYVEFYFWDALRIIAPEVVAEEV